MLLGTKGFFYRSQTMRHVWAAVCLSLICGGAMAASSTPAVGKPDRPVVMASPKALLQSVSDEMIQALKKRQGDWEAHEDELDALITRIMVPHMAVSRMARSVVGRQYWVEASPKVRQAFTKAFQKMVVRTYSAAFATYDGEVVKIYPVRDHARDGRVAIKTGILRKNGQNIMVTYYFIRLGGRWLVDDFDVEGIRLVANYRAQYADPLHQGGLAHLTQLVEQHNQRIADGR